MTAPTIEPPPRTAPLPDGDAGPAGGCDALGVTFQVTGWMAAAAGAVGACASTQVGSGDTGGLLAAGLTAVAAGLTTVAFGTALRALAHHLRQQARTVVALERLATRPKA